MDMLNRGNTFLINELGWFLTSFLSQRSLPQRDEPSELTLAEMLDTLLCRVTKNIFCTVESVHDKLSFSKSHNLEHVKLQLHPAACTK